MLGDDHPDTLESINNLGILFWVQGKTDEAEPYLRKALAGRRRLLGDLHPDTLVSIHYIGVLLWRQANSGVNSWSQENLSEAEPYIREALEGRRTALGNEHPATLSAMNDLGVLLMPLGRHAEGERYFREALETRLRLFGDEDRGTLESISNMGWMLLAQGKMAEAEPYCRSALERSRRMLGDNHTNTLAAMNNLASVLRGLGKFEEAELLATGAARGALNHLGPQHVYAWAFAEHSAQLYDAWHAAEPGKGYDLKATEWRAQSAELQAQTKRGTPPSAAASQPTSAQ